MDLNLIIAAYHECGHALIYYLLGHDVLSLSVDSDGTGFCESHTYRPSQLILNDPNNHEKFMLNFAMKNLSGYISEHKSVNQIFDINKFKQVPKVEVNEPPTDAQDLMTEMDLVNRIFKKEHYGFEFLKASYDATCEIINKDNCWRAIEGLTEELVESKSNSLEHDAIHKIFDSFNLEMIN